MKYFTLKTAVLFLTCVFLLLTAGCGKAADTVRLGEINGGDLDESQSYFSPDARAQVAKGENGYYYMDSYGKYIKYYDIASDDEIVLCSKAECSHDNRECNAYLGGEYLYQVYFYKGYLYLLNISKGNIELVRCKADGSGREALGELCESSDYNVSVVFLNDYVYFSKNQGEISDREREICIYRMSLDKREVETVYTYNGVNSAFIKLRGYGSNLYFTIMSVEADENGKFSRSGKGLFCYNSESGEVNKVIDESIYDYCIDTDKGYIYYYVYGEGLYRAKDKIKEKVFEATDQTGFCDLSYDGRFVYMENSGWSTFSPAFMKNDTEITKYIWIFDDGEEFKTIDVSGEHILSIINGDSQYFFALRYDGMDCFNKDKFFGSGVLEWRGDKTE